MQLPKNQSQQKKPPPKLANQQQGKQGEQLAKKLLQSKGYQFLAQNYRTKQGEIDLIFKDKFTVVFVEVKTRSQLVQGIPEEAVTSHKLRVIERVAEQYLQENRLENTLARIDVVAVELIDMQPVLRHLEDVTN